MDLWFVAMTDLNVMAKPARKGNYKPGPGRPPGRKNNATLAMEAAARKAAADIDGAFDGDAHAFLQAVYKNPDVPLEVRIMAAGRALRVEKPTLSASHSQVDVNLNLANRLEAARKRVAGRDVVELDGNVVPRITDQSGGGVPAAGDQ